MDDIRAKLLDHIGTENMKFIPDLNIYESGISFDLYIKSGVSNYASLFRLGCVMDCQLMSHGTIKIYLFF